MTIANPHPGLVIRMTDAGIASLGDRLDKLLANPTTAKHDAGLEAALADWKRRKLAAPQTPQPAAPPTGPKTLPPKAGWTEVSSDVWVYSR